MSRRIRCPQCRTMLIVTAAASERGRMRCPECQEVVEVASELSEGEELRRLMSVREERRIERMRGRLDRPRRDDPEDDAPGPRRRTEKSGSLLWLWILLGAGGLVLAICAGGIVLLIRTFDSGARESPVPLMQARSGFQTTINRVQRFGNGPAPQPPNGSFRVVKYSSPAGQLAAYLTPDPRDGLKRPAVIWAHSGTHGIDESVWAEGSGPLQFARAGFVVMCPSWRGENDNPGRYEMYFGEIDDAVAAVEYAAKLPYVDSKRIYMVGADEGGTITLLTVEATDKLRAAFAISATPDIGTDLGPRGLGDPDDAPFPISDKKERRLRCAIDYIHHVRTATFCFDSEVSDNIDDARQMEARAQRAGAPVKLIVLDDSEDAVDPLCGLITRKIKTDAGATCNIGITSAEANKACAEAAPRD